MKKEIFTLLISFVTFSASAQITYYWVGGSTGSWGGSSNWNTSRGGGGAARTTAASTDILIIDGSNLGKDATGNLTVSPSSQTIGQLKLTNAADLVLFRSATDGTTTLRISGDNNNSTPDLAVDATSKLSISGTTGSLLVVMEAAANGEIAGSLKIEGPAGISNRLGVLKENALVFLSGSSATINSSYNAFDRVGTNSVDRAVIFNSGSNLIYAGGASPFGNSVAHNIAVLTSGSNIIFEAPTANNMFGNSTNPRRFGNIIIRNSATITADGTLGYVENLEVANGATFNLPASGGTPISGNVVNAGTITGSGTNNLIFIGSTPQVISGPGAFNLSHLVIGTDADVSLQANLNLGGTSTSSVTGSLDLGNRTISGSCAFQFRGANEVSGTPATTTAGSTTLAIDPSLYASGTNDANVALGLRVSGPGIPANTYITGTNSASSLVTLSQAATQTGPTTITITGNSPTISTSNNEGIDGGILVTGTKNFSSSSNYIFNAPSISPFSLNSMNNAKSITINAPLTSNRSIDVSGTLTLNSKLTINAGDTVTLTSGGILAGSFGPSAYLASQVNTSTGEPGFFRMNGISSSTLIPVGSELHYLPVTLSPQSASDFQLNVFEGVSINAAANGSSVSAEAKKGIVDAVWNIDRINGSGDSEVILNWQSALEGVNFAALGNTEIGLAQYGGSLWGSYSGSGDNTLNTATGTFSSFGPFSVGKVNSTLPIKLISFTAVSAPSYVSINWHATELNFSHYILQHSLDGLNFSDLSQINGKSSATNSYSYNHLNAANGDNYYRLISVDQDGSQSTSTVIGVRYKKLNAIVAYPNPINSNTLNVSGLASGDVIKLVNINGAVVLQKTVSDNSSSSLDVQNLIPGNYIVIIESKGKVLANSKVVKL